MKRSKLCGILVLAILSSVLIFYMTIPKANAQAQVNYAVYNYTNVSGTDINVTILGNVGILIDGGVSIWGLSFNVFTNNSISSVIVRGTTNGTKYDRGLTFVTTGGYKNDIPLYGQSPFPPLKMFNGAFIENLLLVSGIYGIPNEYSFNVSIFVVKNETSNQTFCLTSGNSPLVTIILQNPDSSTQIGSLFVALLYSMPFIIPVSIFVVHLVFKKMEKRKAPKSEREMEMGGESNET